MNQGGRGPFYVLWRAWYGPCIRGRCLIRVPDLLPPVYPSQDPPAQGKALLITGKSYRPRGQPHGPARPAGAKSLWPFPGHSPPALQARPPYPAPFLSSVCHICQGFIVSYLFALAITSAPQDFTVVLSDHMREPCEPDFHLARYAAERKDGRDSPDRESQLDGPDAALQGEDCVQQKDTG